MPSLHTINSPAEMSLMSALGYARYQPWQLATDVGACATENFETFHLGSTLPPSHALVSFAQQLALHSSLHYRSCKHRKGECTVQVVGCARGHIWPEHPQTLQSWQLWTLVPTSLLQCHPAQLSWLLVALRWQQVRPDAPLALLT